VIDGPADEAPGYKLRPPPVGSAPAALMYASAACNPMHAGTSGADPAISGTEPKAVWGAGDFAPLAPAMTIVSEELCESVDLRARQAVLDVACGTGNTALAAARRRCQVTGVDLLPELLERGRRRAEAEGLRLELRVGDGDALEFGDARFDAVLSTFGVIFSSRPERAFSEMLRVCRPGGIIGLTAWVDEGFTGPLIFRCAELLPAGSGLQGCRSWADPEWLARQAGDRVAGLEVRRRVVRLRADSEESQAKGVARFLGPVAAALAARGTEERSGLTEEILARVRANNRATDGTVLVESPYIEVLARRAADPPRQAI